MRVASLPGDGIGPEVCAAAVRVLDALPIEVAVEEHSFGGGAIREHGDPLPAGQGGAGQSFGMNCDLFRAVVQQGGQAVQLGRPAAAGEDLPQLPAQGTAGDDQERRLSRGTATARRSGR